MTDEEIKKKAEEYAKLHQGDKDPLTGDWVSQADMLRSAYIAGAKENGVVWHDLRKNPDDLPPEGFYWCHRKGGIEEELECELCEGVKSWYTIDLEDVTDEVIAWCEIPKFEG